jgi:peptidoglycan/LPS O-acetylase OafA/YrhL
MRLHFISRLALLIAGSFLVVATQEGVWTGNNTLKWMFVAGGALAIAVAAADAMHDALEQRGLDFLTALLGAWMIVEAFALSQSDLKWWAFGSAAAIAGISAIGLTIHEWSTERVVHELRVTHHEEARRQTEMAPRMPA